MSFRRDGKALHASQHAWSDWIDSVRTLVAEANVPQSVTESEENWWYFVDKTYSQAGYVGDEVWFGYENMSSEQRIAFWHLLCRWLEDWWPDVPDYKRRSLQASYGPSSE